MCTVCAVVNQKGGVGKTTTCANLGIGLARHGKKVLLIDTDPQGSLTASLGYPQPDKLPVTLATVMGKVLNETPPATDEGMLHHFENVDLLPANIELSGIDMTLVNAMSRETILRQYISIVEPLYDYVLLDCMPSLGMLTINALAAADTVIIPVQAQYLPVKGLEQLLQTIAKVRRQINPKLNIDGILLTMVDTRTNYAKDIIALLMDAYGDIGMSQPLAHDYYYGHEAEQYIFYRLPKALFTNSHYKNLSDSAKILYGLMLDRMGLSIKNGWMDEEHRVFIYFTLEDLQDYMRCGHNKGVKLMAELDAIGLIERVKQGQGKPTRIFVKKFFSESRDPCYTAKSTSFPQGYAQGNQDFRKEEIQTSDNGKSRLPHMGSADFPKTECNKNYVNHTEINNTDLSENYPIQSYPQQDTKAVSSSNTGWDKDGMRERNAYRNLIMDNLEYDILIQQYGDERMDEVVDLLTDTVCSKRDYITIAADDYPKEVVKSRLLKLNSSHLEYVFDCIDKNTTKVRNVRKYLLAALYNAPTTMDTYYRAEVNHDMYGGENY